MHAPKSGLSEGAAHGQKRKTEILIDTLRMIFKHALIKCEHIHRNERKKPGELYSCNFGAALEVNIQHLIISKYFLLFVRLF